MTQFDHTCDIAIIGGSIIGSAVAYFLLRSGHGGKVCIVEPDPSYEFAAAPRSSGNIRRLWGSSENIQMADFSRDFYLRFNEEMALDGDGAPVGWCERGYLWLVPEGGRAQLEHNQRLQRRFGIETEILGPSEIVHLFPSLDLKGVEAAAWSPMDGWLDGYLVVRGFRRKARSLGATYIQDRVVGLDSDRVRVRAVRLASGGKVTAELFVNAAGAWAPALAEMIGMTLPVVPMRRMKFYFDIAREIEPLPAIRDFPRLTFRPEGRGHFAGISNLDDPVGFNFDVDHAFFEETVWPALAARVPAFEALKVRNAWAGHYEQNIFDTCLIVGPWIGGLRNFHVITGFSGNGIMHGPAAARGLSELILHGKFLTIDLTRMTYQRVIDNKPLKENIVI